MIAAIAALLVALRVYSALVVHLVRLSFKPQGEFVSVEGQRLHYLRRGTGQAVVLLHASGLTLQDFEFSLLDLLAESYEVIAFDRPGYGHSERPSNQPLTLALNARLLHGALSQMGIEQPILVGHSGGGAVALRYAIDYPSAVKGVVLLAPGAYAKGLPRPPLFLFTDTPLLGPLFLHTLWTPLAQWGAGAFFDGLFAPDPPPEGYVRSAKVFYSQPNHFRTHAHELRNLAAGLRQQSPRYGEIQVPVTILTGTDDKAAPPESQANALHRAIPHSQLLSFSATGHAFHHKYPLTVLETIAKIG
jgi:pimeloyl-ACP methyl ester carboxylesterase